MAFAVHLVLVLGLLALLWRAIASVPRGGGANIGAGLLLLPILALGMPRSLLIDPYRLDALPWALHISVQLLPAVLNLVLHGVLVAHVLRRERRRR